MCEQCNKLKEQLEEERHFKKKNYEAYQELKKKFEKLAVAYCYQTDIDACID